MLTKTKRPKFLNLLKIRLPITGIVSILHRISGVLLFISLPFIIYGFSLSLQSPEGFTRIQAYTDNLLVQLLGSIFVWAIAHHFIAGLRFLLLDVDIGLKLKTARATSWLAIVLAVSIAGYIILRWLL